MKTRGKAKIKSVSEVHAYVFILKELIERKGWVKKQVYTQQECFNHPELKKQLEGKVPENIVNVNEKLFYVIEAKNKREKLDLALKEAQEDYAQRINSSKIIQSPLITGIAGNDDDGYIAKSQYLVNREWKTITENGIEVTGLLSKQQVERILETNNPALVEVEISDNEFIKTAEEINGILHEGGINKDSRAKVISAILLALSEGTDITLSDSPSVLINAINTRVDLVLKKHKKAEFSRFLKIDLPSSEDNHNKFKKAVVLTIQELLGLNIRSAMQSGKDVLGKFYEVFLKYGNGAKEIGIVLTPRHITKFAAEIFDIQPNDFVLDVTCGTGGFLVAAFDEVRKKANDEQFHLFKNYGLYGVEEQDAVVSLAVVNMIFRGDGKNNIIEGNCFAKWLNATVVKDKTTNKEVPCAEYLSENNEKRVPPITKVLMNPPFPKKKTDFKEFLFIEQALKQMQNDGLLFSVLPYSCLIKGGYLKWRQRLIRENTVLAVVTFPEDLFYPVGVHTLGLIVKKGTPHKGDQRILWLRAIHDGRWKKKGKRLEHPKAENDYLKITPLLTAFLKDQSIVIPSIPAFQKVCSLDPHDADLELVPEAYLDEKPVTEAEMEANIDQIMRENIAFMVKYNDKLKIKNTS